MPKVSSKRQITLPIEQCEALGIKHGGEVESFVADNKITIVKISRGALYIVELRVRSFSLMKMSGL